uniref:Beta-defensin-like domain-containing protein n=1 Tax=Dromaius novaehollandiae TaxID=8790 RepID=A0A8C4KLY5_DRONO
MDFLWCVLAIIFLNPPGKGGKSCMLAGGVCQSGPCFLDEYVIQHCFGPFIPCCRSYISAARKYHFHYCFPIRNKLLVNHVP